MWRVTLLKIHAVLPQKYYVMYFGFPGNNGNIEWDAPDTRFSWIEMY